MYAAADEMDERFAGWLQSDPALATLAGGDMAPRVTVYHGPAWAGLLCAWLAKRLTGEPVAPITAPEWATHLAAVIAAEAAGDAALATPHTILRALQAEELRHGEYCSHVAHVADHDHAFREFWSAGNLDTGLAQNKTRRLRAWPVVLRRLAVAFVHRCVLGGTVQIQSPRLLEFDPVPPPRSRRTEREEAPEPVLPDLKDSPHPALRELEQYPSTKFAYWVLSTRNDAHWRAGSLSDHMQMCDDYVSMHRRIRWDPRPEPRDASLAVELDEGPVPVSCQRQTGTGPRGSGRQCTCRVRRSHVRR